MDNVILVDCDGVLLNWEYAFNTWMHRHGYRMKPGGEFHYDMGDRYGLPYDEKKRLVKFFNESSAIGFLPPLRDAIHYVQKLHRKHGYVFHVITSLSLEPSAQELRTQNLKKLFGEGVFEKFVYLDTGADKEEALEPYRDTGYFWVEDKPENYTAGYNIGLDSILVEHGHNMHLVDEDYLVLKNWKEIYQYVTGDM
jgi:beta-phosphoglucomutase-like phosphatase (HAD superfamily)